MFNPVTEIARIIEDIKEIRRDIQTLKKIVKAVSDVLNQNKSE